MDDIVVYENVLNDKDLLWFEQKKDQSIIVPRSKKDDRKNILYQWHMPEQQKEIENYLYRFTKYKPNYEYFFSSQIYDIQIPYAIHSDTNGEYQGIVPMDIDPADKQTYTLIFDQTTKINSEYIHPLMQKDSNYKPHFNKAVYDPTEFEGWTDEYKISDEDGQKYWGDTWFGFNKEIYKGFSIKHAYQWNVGDIFMFHSKYMHAATNMNTKGINKKTGLLFLYIPVDKHPEMHNRHS